MAAVGNYVHSLGLKFGLYITPGIPVAAYNAEHSHPRHQLPCAGYRRHAAYLCEELLFRDWHRTNTFEKVMYNIDYTKPGAQEFINSWANLFASYGIDYLKLDGISSGTVPRHPGLVRGPPANRPADPLRAFRQRLHQCPTRQRLAHRCRHRGLQHDTVYPLTDWSNVAGRFSAAPNYTAAAGPGHWSDLDSLEVGNGANTGLTADQRQTAMTLWATACSPLFLGPDLTNMDSGDLALLTNDEDAGGQPGRPCPPRPSPTTPPPRSGGRCRRTAPTSSPCTNLGTASATVGVTWAQLGFAGAASDVRDLWSQTDLGAMDTGFSDTLVAYGSRLLRVVPAIPVDALPRGCRRQLDCRSGGLRP